MLPSLCGTFLPQMNSSISEADAGEHTGQVHAGPGLQILWVPHRSAISQSTNQSISLPDNKIVVNDVNERCFCFNKCSLFPQIFHSSSLIKIKSNWSQLCYGLWGVPQGPCSDPVWFSSSTYIIYRFMYLATTLRAWRDHTSLMGLLPW